MHSIQRQNILLYLTFLQSFKRLIVEFIYCYNFYSYFADEVNVSPINERNHY